MKKKYFDKKSFSLLSIYVCTFIIIIHMYIFGNSGDEVKIESGFYMSLCLKLSFRVLTSPQYVVYI